MIHNKGMLVIVFVSIWNLSRLPCFYFNKRTCLQTFSMYRSQTIKIDVEFISFTCSGCFMVYKKITCFSFILTKKAPLVYVI